MGSNVFLGSNTFHASFNVAQAEWVAFAEAMAALPGIVSARVYQEATLRLLEDGLTFEQRLFWKSVAEGCRNP